MASVDQLPPAPPDDPQDGIGDAACAGPDLHESVQKLRVLRDSLAKDVRAASSSPALRAPLRWLRRTAPDDPTGFFRPRPPSRETLARLDGLAARGVAALATRSLSSG
jgi:hypothetical protein